MCRSVPQIPQAPTFTTISPRPCVGSSTVPTLMSPGFSMIAAFMSSPLYLTAPVVSRSPHLGRRSRAMWLLSYPTAINRRVLDHVQNLEQVGNPALALFLALGQHLQAARGYPSDGVARRVAGGACLHPPR